MMMINLTPTMVQFFMTVEIKDYRFKDSATRITGGVSRWVDTIVRKFL
jgi:hypothetical protein